MKPPIFIAIFLIKTQIKSTLLADKYKGQSHKFMRRNSLKYVFKWQMQILLHYLKHIYYSVTILG